MTARRPVASVDCGTNTTRLLVLDADGAEVAREVTITRLGAGVDRRGHLDDDALARTLAVLAGYRQQWERAGVDAAHVRIAATSAVRDAADRARFFDGARTVAGVQAEVLSGDEEARLSFVGAVGGVQAEAPCAVLDIGGGSTELVLGDAAGAFVAGHSMQIGAVRLTERYLPSDPPAPAEIERARASIAAELDILEQRVDRAGLRAARSLVGVAGTVTTLVALDLDLAPYDPERVHGSVLSATAVAGWLERLAGLTTAQRAALPQIQPGREDVIVAGVLILDAVLARYGFAQVTVSEADILDGLAASIR